ncbi:uncharacterized protein LOC129797328 isoform X2 [Lutzomyia longipalpis]|uniref:uncharacterized protein LOC129797328 isoform X2 n=1 Tax=Lutzomyia longipalpis TaxID=7200 RepID=UPI002483C040|nr:uncharacterized protein LOC129797328 isoform X2 [Lutzomyia longipalpis]
MSRATFLHFYHLALIHVLIVLVGTTESPFQEIPTPPPAMSSTESPQISYNFSLTSANAPIEVVQESPTPVPLSAPLVYNNDPVAVTESAAVGATTTASHGRRVVSKGESGNKGRKTVEDKFQRVLKTNSSQTNSSVSRNHKTDAPMLNYIFDSHIVNKHHHHDFRFGPRFEDTIASQANVTVREGGTAYFNCKITYLADKMVSWVRRNPETDELQLLTVGHHTYSADSRYSVDFEYPNNWRLRIVTADRRDEGIYECQISTHPPRVIQIYFYVSEPEVVIVDEQGLPLYEKYYEVDSTLDLICIVRHVKMTTSMVHWVHGEALLNYDTNRGGISVRTDLMDEGANSTLSVAKLNKSDSGNYTCSIGPTQFFTTSVHVLNESLAELYHGSGVPLQIASRVMWPLLIVYLATKVRYILL